MITQHAAEVFQAPQVRPDLTVPGESYSQVVVGHSRTLVSRLGGAWSLASFSFILSQSPGNEVSLSFPELIKVC